MVPFDMLGMVSFLLVCYSNCPYDVPFFRYSTWPWNPGLVSLKVIGIDTDRSATSDFLLTFRSNRGPIPYRFRYKQRFQSKIAKFPHPVYFASQWRGSPWNGYRRWGQKPQWWGYRAEKEVRRYLQPCGYNPSTWQTDRQTDRRTDGRTDGRTDTGWQQRPRLHIASRSKNGIDCRYTRQNALAAVFIRRSTCRQCIVNDWLYIEVTSEVVFKLGDTSCCNQHPWIMHLNLNTISNT